MNKYRSDKHGNFVIELGDFAFNKVMQDMTDNKTDVREVVALIETKYGAMLCESQYKALHEAQPEHESINNSLKRNLDNLSFEEYWEEMFKDTIPMTRSSKERWEMNALERMIDTDFDDDSENK